LLFAKADKPPVKGEPQTDPTHSAVLGLMLQDTLAPLGVTCEVRHPLDGKEPLSLQDLLIETFNSPTRP
ncbi:MAG TPA: hypothetical protein PLA50_07675, partial [Bacteroidia bacterium]|nr:hypothetical protein [Bacteroidia bacterium]